MQKRFPACILTIYLCTKKMWRKGVGLNNWKRGYFRNKADFKFGVRWGGGALAEALLESGLVLPVIGPIVPRA